MLVKDSIFVCAFTVSHDASGGTNKKWDFQADVLFWKTHFQKILLLRSLIL